MNRRWMLIGEIALMVGLCAWIAWTFLARAPKPQDSVEIKIQLQGAKDRAYVFRDSQGRYCYQITRDDGQSEVIDAQKFAERVYQDHRSRGWLEMLMNVTGPAGIAWVVVGLLGQVLFTGRMVVQWMASEKKKESVVPPVFWWMSLVGATMLLVYFLWRKDPVGVIGQGFGWFIYVRNLWLIYRKRESAEAVSVAVTQDPGPEPELT